MRVRAETEWLFPAEFGRLPFPAGRVNLRTSVSGYTNFGSAIGRAVELEKEMESGETRQKMRIAGRSLAEAKAEAVQCR
jgi:hypothetical protein